VLELGGQAAVRRYGGPAVVPHVAVDAPHGQDRLWTRKFGSIGSSQEHKRVTPRAKNQN